MKRAKLSFERLANLDAVALLSRHVRMVEFDAEQRKETIIRNSLSNAPTPRHCRRSKEQHLAYRRRMVVGLIKRLHLDTAQSFKHGNPRRFKRLKSHPVISGHI